MKTETAIERPLDEIVGTSDSLVPQYIRKLLSLICKVHGESTIELEWCDRLKRWHGWGAYDVTGRITVPRNLTGCDKRIESVRLANSKFGKHTILDQIALLEYRLSPNVIRVSWDDYIFDRVLIKHFRPNGLTFGEWITQEEASSTMASILAWVPRREKQ